MVQKQYLWGIVIVIITIALVYFPFSKRTAVLLDEEVYPADHYLRQGLTALSRDSLQDAEKHLKIAIQYQPHYALSHYYLAHVYVRQGNTQEAVAELTQTIKIDPEFYHAFYRLGVLVGERGEYSRAITYLKRAVVLNPYYREAYHALAEFFIETGDFKAADEIYELLQTLGKSQGR